MHEENSPDGQTGHPTHSSALANTADVDGDNRDVDGLVGQIGAGDGDGLCTMRVSVVLRLNGRRLTRKRKPGFMEVRLPSVFGGRVTKGEKRGVACPMLANLSVCLLYVFT